MKDLVHPRSVEYRALRRSSPSPEVYAHADGEVKSMAINPPVSGINRKAGQGCTE